jgi:prevent-host-death family protein
LCQQGGTSRKPKPCSIGYEEAGLARFRLTQEHSYDGHMMKAKIADLKNNLSRYLDHVKAGRTVMILDRNTPVARIVPLTKVRGHAETDEARLTRLERSGLIRRGTGGSLQWLLRREPAKVEGASLVEELLKEREGGW